MRAKNAQCCWVMSFPGMALKNILPKTKLGTYLLMDSDDTVSMDVRL